MSIGGGDGGAYVFLLNDYPVPAYVTTYYCELDGIIADAATDVMAIQ